VIKSSLRLLTFLKVNGSKGVRLASVVIVRVTYWISETSDELEVFVQECEIDERRSRDVLYTFAAQLSQKAIEGNGQGEWELIVINVD
jgi:hypothetical protein